MPRWAIERPEKAEFEDNLNRLVSISAVARHYHITFTTAKKWIKYYGLGPLLSGEAHTRALRRLEEEGPKAARRIRIDSELDRTLGEIGDRKPLARAIVDEFSMRYIFKRCFSWERYVLELTLVMYDFPPFRKSLTWFVFQIDCTSGKLRGESGCLAGCYTLTDTERSGSCN